jgi:hypothetical protein
MHGATSLYEYPSHDLNVYADEDMTMEVAEPATTPWTYVNPPPCNQMMIGMPMDCRKRAHSYHMVFIDTLSVFCVSALTFLLVSCVLCPVSRSRFPCLRVLHIRCFLFAAHARLCT